MIIKTPLRPHPDFRFLHTLKIVTWQLLIACCVFGWCDRSYDWYRHWRQVGPSIVIAQFFTVLFFTAGLAILKPKDGRDS
jgi:hypothetical protein